MVKIKLLNEISDIIYNALDRSAYDVSKEQPTPDAILVRSADMHEAQLNPELLAIARAGVGTNNIPIARCSEAGVVVFFAPGANANAVKELVMAGMLLATRDLVGGIEWVRSIADQGDKIPAMVEKGKKNFVGPELQGKTLGVIGLGNIGGPVATLGIHFHMDVLGFDPYMTVDAAWSVSRAVHRAPSEDAVVAQADYLTLHVPLNDETRGKVNGAFIAGMKQGAVLLNFSRGEVVDDDAVLAALASGKLRAYVTDFPNERLIGQKGVIAIPHLGASTPESEENCAEMVSRQIHGFFTTGTIRNSVNLPDCELAPPVGYRITVVHKNIPNMLSQVTAAVAREGINITNMLNRSRKDMAYTVLDLEQEPPASIDQDLTALDGIIRVRVIKG